ncbi:MAG: acyl-CoA thioesterase [Thiohalomonadales bacterium]
MKHITIIHIRYNDIDTMGHVNNAAYLQYFEQARIEWFTQTIGSEWDWKTAGFVLARNEIDYKQPLLLHDKAIVETSVENIGIKSFTLCYNVIKKQKDLDLLVASGKSVLVCFDNKTQKTKPIPEEWRLQFTNE